MNQPFFDDDFFSFVEEVVDLASPFDLLSAVFAGEAEAASFSLELLYPSLR